MSTPFESESPLLHATIKHDTAAMTAPAPTRFHIERNAAFLSDGSLPAL
ncbi:hypothetical protein [Candidatus Burkholderia verschuerenii]|nr:hypothetical protein [Candidatus Burkholderia verschuerenii]